MKKTFIIVDVFRDIVGKVSDAVLAELQVFDPKITSVRYEHGHPLEIIETLGQLGAAPSSKFNRYPIVALFQDFPEDVSDVPGIDREITVQMIIARGTTPTLKASARYDKNFRPVLYPVYFELLKQISKSPAFTVKSETQIKHRKFDRLFWGRDGLYGNSKNVFNDWLDCIELKELKLKVNPKFC